jgi:hypothetical protein
MPMSPPKDTSAGSPQRHAARPARAKVMDYRTLRAVIGGIVILLVPVVYIGNWLFIRHLGGCFYNPQWIPGSLSGFYYTHMRNLFVGAMCAVGVFLVAYRGHDRWDDRLTNVAGLAAIFIGLFPTLPPGHSKSPNGPNPFFTRANPCGPSTPITYHPSPHQSLIRYVHVVSLLVLFLMVFLMVLAQFTRTKPSKAEQQPPVRGSLRAWWKALFPIKQLARRIRAWRKGLFAVKQRRAQNRVFVACAGGIALSALLALFTAIWSSAVKTVPLLLFAEVLAFLCFGIAWFVKGSVRARGLRAELIVEDGLFDSSGQPTEHAPYEGAIEDFLATPGVSGSDVAAAFEQALNQAEQETAESGGWWDKLRGFFRPETHRVAAVDNCAVELEGYWMTLPEVMGASVKLSVNVTSSSLTSASFKIAGIGGGPTFTIDLKEGLNHQASRCERVVLSAVGTFQKIEVVRRGNVIGTYPRLISLVGQPHFRV